MQAAGKDEVHVVAGTLEYLDVAILFAEYHVFVVLLLGGGVRGRFRVHLDEGLATWLTLSYHESATRWRIHRRRKSQRKRRYIETHLSSNTPFQFVKWLVNDLTC